MSRITCPVLRQKITNAKEAASFIHHGHRVAMSGFTGAGYPKQIPEAVARTAQAAHRSGDDFGIELLTGASTAPELDGVLAAAGAVTKRLPFQSDPTMRERINSGATEYVDTHLSHAAQQAWFGFYGTIDVAVVEVAAVLPNGLLVPGSSVGNNKSWLELADKVILEVNEWHPRDYEGFHDVYYGTRLPPQRRPLQVEDAMQRIGDPYLRVDPEKVVAVVPTHAPDRNLPFKPPDETSRAIAEHVVDFLRYEIRHQRLPENLFPLQSGVGNVANAVMAEFAHSEFEHLTAYTEVIQDGMLDLIDTGKLESVSATSFSLSAERAELFNARAEEYKGRILLRTQEISNHPEIIRRLGLIAINGMVEADIYGNVNSTHVMGSSIINGIGGSGDFARNAYLNFFVSGSTAKAGKISSIVPFASHIDHTEHDTHIIVTEQGLADLRGLSPVAKARRIIAECAHPDYREALDDYLNRALKENPHGRHTPHLLTEALSWHRTYQVEGSMRPSPR